MNLAKRGILTLNVEWVGMGQLGTAGFGHGRMNQIDLCGASGLAIHVLAMERAIDFLIEQPGVRRARIGLAGLSGGGWQTIVGASLDTRVTFANPVAGYSSFLTRLDHYGDLGDSEQTPVDLGAVADYATLTACWHRERRCSRSMRGTTAASPRGTRYRRFRKRRSRSTSCWACRRADGPREPPSGGSQLRA